MNQAESALREQDAITTTDASTLSLTDFWEARPYLAHIREAAHSRQRSAEAVLGVVLARTSALVDHRLRLPAIVGAQSSLTVFSVITGASGLGKSTANAVAASLLPAPEDFVDLPIGSGEGIAEAFYGTVDTEVVDEKTGKMKKIKVRQQVRHNAFFYVDEGQVMGQLGRRGDSTLMPTLRSAFSGSALGNQNAEETRRRIVPGDKYALGVVIGIQVNLAAELMGDTDGGTSQRFLWFGVTDPSIPDIEDQPTWPGVLGWKMPPLPPTDSGWLIEGENGSRDMGVDPAIVLEIKSADLAKARNSVIVDTMDSHAQLIRLKVAGLLAVLDGRTSISLQDWELAEHVQRRSNAVRQSVMASLDEEKRRKTRERDDAQVRSSMYVEDRRDEGYVIRTAKTILDKIQRRADGQMTLREVQQSLSSKQRERLDDALGELTARRHIRQFDYYGTATVQLFSMEDPRKRNDD
jgi:hypothetical protein